MAAGDPAEAPVSASDDAVDEDEVDPRRLRSRARLLDAAASLLSSGGVEAVTVDAVTRVSKVARTTLYRHFGSTTHLLAAAFERLLPQVSSPPASGDLRDQLIELVHRQAALIDEAPLHLTALAWLALRPSPHSDARQPLAGLSARVIEQYRRPFDELLAGPAARAELDDFDTTLAIIQLVAPIVFAKLTGMKTLTAHDRVRIVDDFLSAHRSPTRGPA
ncbi:TetR/AcrR family transcriptional regulator [Mycobacterium xenopi]|uniref:TetR/AcrR family transcriptional regulator n=1 Tax=Mycobacterium xenopi TaxID=1789 RepID=UPI0022EAF114|nr:TetR/AcrR family transcriptional regulator [Mycobacterium xenopi]MDA3638809.1 TetR/AcrR family transcriptional regulator [Mycobacterium xenopi]MDA3658780.1 TetR/AcrR family transcriptional regulator [Mycobacterium xenopi]MDA3663746.1 TetR/AcrR family transcriptional regulator [Mycobacterium xenopi]